MDIKQGDLLVSDLREEEDEVCFVLQVYSESLVLVQRSRKRSYEKTKIAHINPVYYKVIQ
tara:strand:- start:79 stop:258 length:180 start_codon:yes stop_codon:yes gene_type:complete